jgi:glycosyltransferase involved in cell wall biosynthesis
MYETVRDMIAAERLAGHTSELVDTGVDGERAIGGVDDRGGCRIETRRYSDVADFNVFVPSVELPPFFTEPTQAPIVAILHGRPESSFRLQQTDPKAPVYDLVAAKAANPRVKRLVSLWPEHLPYWCTIVPTEKLVSTTAPPCDLSLYAPDGPRHEFAAADRGQVNILVADIWRPDADPFHVAHGLLLVAGRVDGLKVHFYACQSPLGPWRYVFEAFQRVGALGETNGMMADLDQVMRACDLVVTPHRIATRIIRESLACGVPVVAGTPCQWTPYQAMPGDPLSVASVVEDVIEDDPATMREAARDMAAVFGLDRIGPELIAIYEQAIGA